LDRFTVSLDGWNGKAHEEGLHVHLQPSFEAGLLCFPYQRTGAKYRLAVAMVQVWVKRKAKRQYRGQGCNKWSRSRLVFERVILEAGNMGYLLWEVQSPRCRNFFEGFELSCTS
jgi:hypothetical protein